MTNRKLIQNRLSLMDNLFELMLLEKKDLRIEFENQRKNCKTLIESIKKLKEESSLDKSYLDKKINLDDVKIAAMSLRNTADDIFYFMRELDRLKPEDYNSLLLLARQNVEKNRHFSVTEQYKIFLKILCLYIKSIVKSLDNIDGIEYDFDTDFADYYIGFLERNIRKEKDFHRDFFAMKEMYKKIYEIIRQLEKLEVKFYREKLKTGVNLQNTGD